MAFFEDRLSPRITYGARGGPVWNTGVAKAESGFRQTNKKWLYPLHRYDVSECIRGDDDFEEVRSFFYVVAGQFEGFRYKDWADFLVTRDRSSITAITGGWQLNRRYAKGIRTFDRPIYKPVDGTIVVYDGSGTPMGVTVDPTTGRFTSGGTPVTWSGEFDVPVAFTSDVMELELVSKNQDIGVLFSWPTVQLEEIRITIP